MIKQSLAAAVLAAAILAPAMPALAQDPAATVRMEGQAAGSMSDTGTNAPVDNVLGTGALPGVGTGLSSAPDTSVISGPGGLQNGVGAQGVAAPSLTGSAVTNDGSVPGTGESGFGIPLDASPTPGG